MLTHPLLAENSLFKAIGDIFHPIFEAISTVLAFIYGIVPNYALSIAILTVLIMAILTPLTVKSTRSMIAMQRLQPEMKKLQQKYKGPENREQLNKELMALYKEHGVNPAGGCIPMLLQMPFLFVLYDIIKGLTNTTSKVIHGHTITIAAPRYIPHSSKMYKSLIAHPGHMVSFGMDLALKPFSHHSSVGAAIPFFVFVAVAVALQFIQMRQMNSRNPQAAQANPQMQTMQKIMPIIFAYIYFLVPAAVVIYMIVSTLARIVTQDVMFRTGMVQFPGAAGTPGKERTIGPAKGPGGPSKAKGEPKSEAKGEDLDTASTNGTNGTGETKSPAPTTPPSARPKTSGQPRASNGTGQTNGSRGSTSGGTTPRPNQANRSKAKRTRRTR